MKILLVTEHYPPHIAGMAVWVYNLAINLAKLGQEVRVVTMKFPDTTAYEESSGVKIYRVAVPSRLGRYLFNLFCIPTLWKQAKECDIVHAACENNIIPTWFVAKLLRKKRVVTYFEPLGNMWTKMASNYFYAKLIQLMERISMSLGFDKHACGSRYARNCARFMGVSDEKLVTIYQGIDYDFFDPNKADGAMVRKRLNLDEKFVYFSFGRPGITKGVEYLVQAVPEISEKIPNSRLMLIMTHEPKDRYRAIVKLIKDLGIENNVLLLDPVPRNELPNYIAAADCVVVPSLSEGFGNTIGEACAMERPLVATDAGSLPEVACGRYVLVEPRSARAIAEGVRRIYNDETETTKKKMFTWMACAEKYLKVYDDILKKGKGKKR